MSTKLYMYEELVNQIEKNNVLINRLKNEIDELKKENVLYKNMQDKDTLDVAMLKNFIVNEELTLEQIKKLNKILKVSDN